MPLIIKMSGKLCDKSGEIGLPNLVKTQQTGVSVSEMYNNNDMQNYTPSFVKMGQFKSLI